MFIFSKIKDLTIPEGIKEIQKDAFFRSKITNIIFPKSLEIIGKNAFYDCENLKNLKLPQNIKRIEGRAFIGCKNLQNIDIPVTIEYLSPTAFLTSTFLYKLKFNDSSDNFIKICPINELNVYSDIEHLRVKCTDCILDIVWDDKYNEYRWIKI